MTSHACKAWCFTLHDYTDKNEATLQLLGDPKKDPKFSYLCYGREKCPSTNRLHLQGTLILFKKLRLKNLKELIGDPRIALFKRRGTAKEASDYCKKDGDFYEVGSFETDQGKRTDLLAAKAFIDAGCTLEEFREEHFELWVKYRVALEEYMRSRLIDPSVCQYPLRPWQESLRVYLSQTPHSRKIKFIVDFEGNTGKTWFANWYKQDNEYVQVLKPEKRADTAIQIKLDSRVIFFNVPKNRTAMIAYDILEDIKDGRISSPKYQSHTAPMQGPCHVVVLMNEYPDMNALSKDRYDIETLTNPNIAAAVNSSIRNSPDIDSLIERNTRRSKIYPIFKNTV